MKTLTRTDDLYAAATRQLESYLATGIEGFRVQAWDRCRVLGMNLAGLTQDLAGAQHLLTHIRGW